jgi:hypothetical protein
MGKLPADEIVGGQIIRHTDGTPTGECSANLNFMLSPTALPGVFVDNAMNLIPLPPWNHKQMEEYFRTTINAALQYGLTSIHDADTKLPMIEFFKKFV